MNIEAMKIVRDNLKMGHVLSFAEMMIIQQAIDAAMLQGGNHTEQHLDMVNSPVIPDGWVLVPKQITLEMECALSRADSYEIGWQWALAAAPQQESE